MPPARRIGEPFIVQNDRGFGVRYRVRLGEGWVEFDVAPGASFVIRPDVERVDLDVQHVRPAGVRDPQDPGGQV